MQFHQSYAYEDFIQGYRPTDGGGFARVNGMFLRFCHRALQDPTADYVLIIDEINRGNLSKIFGELLMLIEADKRKLSWGQTLTYSKGGEPRFHVPPNVYIIGTMNTADRSLAMVDYALRRRFAFFDLGPGYEHDGFARKLDRLDVDPVLRDSIITRVSNLNQRIAADPNLGNGFCIGHSYFCPTGDHLRDEEWYRRIIRTEIAPLLREYWFDNPETAENQIAQLLTDH